jgi:hypothetical protein
MRAVERTIFVAAILSTPRGCWRDRCMQVKFAVTFDIPNALHALALEEHIDDILNVGRVSVHHVRLMTDAKWRDMMDRQCGPRTRRGWVRRLTKV